MQYNSNRTRSIDNNSKDVVFDICVATETRDVIRTVDGKPYAEVLLCNSENIKFDRLQNKAPLLYNHDWDNHVGIVEEAYVKDNTLRAKVRVSEIGFAGEVLAKIHEGTLSCVSVGYSVLSYRLNETTSTMEVLEWEPHEISVVTVPADINVGFHRQKEFTMNLNETRAIKNDSDDEEHLDEAVEAVEKAAEAEGETPEHEAEEVAEAIEEKREESIDESEQRATEEKTDEQEAESEKPAVNKDGKDAEPQKRNLTMSFNIDSMNTVNKEETRAAAAFDLMGAIRAKADNKQLTGAAAEFEQEALRKGERLRSDSSIILPYDFARSHATQAISGTPVGTATAANGSAVVNQSYRPDMFLQALRSESILGKLGVGTIAVEAGVTKFPRETQQNIKLNGFVNEDALPQNQDYRFETQTIGQKTFACRSSITRSLMMQSNGSILAYVQELLMKDASAALEDAVLNSIGSATSPTGIIPATGSGAGFEVATKSATEWGDKVWATVLGLLRSKNVYGDVTAICSPAVLSELHNVMIGTATGRYLVENGMVRNLFKIVDTSKLNHVTDKIFVGDYSKTKIVQYGSMQLDVDGTSYRQTGGVGLNLFADMDIVHTYPEAYAQIIKKV